SLLFTQSRGGAETQMFAADPHNAGLFQAVHFSFEQRMLSDARPRRIQSNRNVVIRYNKEQEHRLTAKMNPRRDQ
ncbi:MAG TPA: hypothetical protein VHG09_14175, partial [Longimicrobiales bacterium]|nr:hypothetical protein [Longimicrobiales bacterium]